MEIWELWRVEQQRDFEDDIRTKIPGNNNYVVSAHWQSMICVNNERLCRWCQYRLGDFKWTETPSGGDIYNLEERKLTHDKWNVWNSDTLNHIRSQIWISEDCTYRIRKNRAKINEWKGLFLKKLWCWIGEEVKFSFIVWPRKGHWEGESGRYLLPGLPGLCALLPPIETPKKRTTTSRRFSQYYVVRTREPAPFWRENVIAVAIRPRHNLVPRILSLTSRKNSGIEVCPKMHALAKMAKIWRMAYLVKMTEMAKSKLFESPAVWRFSPLQAFLDISAGFGWSCDYLWQGSEVVLMYYLFLSSINASCAA